MPPPKEKLAWIVSRELTRKKNTVYEQAQNNRHKKRQKQYDKRSEKCMQQLTPQRQPGVSYPMKSKGVQDAVCGGTFGVQLRK